jgi:hypothetical protein
MARRPTAADGTKLERRKQTRFPVSVPLEASWKGPDGAVMKEEAVARQVNAHGGLLEMANYPEIGTRVALTNFLSAETREARVLATPNSREGVSHGIVVELIAPNESFWGVSLQVKKAGVELQKLEKNLRLQGIEPRLLKEFRDTVEYMQAIAGSVQQARERQMSGDDESADAWLVGERIRRAINLCLEVMADFDAGRISDETKGAGELRESLEQLTQRLSSLVAEDLARRVIRNAEIRSPEPSSTGRRGRAESRER